MWCMVVRLSRHGLESYEAWVFQGTKRLQVHSAMSEGGARSWLAERGFPFHKQPRFVTVQRGQV